MRIGRLAVFLLMTMIWTLSQASAHSPYFTQTETFTDSARGQLSIRLWHGDGIFFVDPVRAVVLDEMGRMLAVSPKREAMSLFCDGKDDLRGCVAYDHLSGDIFAPDRLDLIGRLLGEDGRPIEYPEYFKEESGFVSRRAGIHEAVWFEARGIVAEPVTTVLAILWWALIWAISLPIFWNWRKHSLGRSMALTALRLTAIAPLLFMTQWSFLIDPYSGIYLLIVCSGGLILYLALSRLRRRRPGGTASAPV